MNFASIFDIIIALIAATFALRGLFKGLSGEIFSLLGTVGGVVVAWKFAGVPAAWLLTWFPTSNPSMVSVGFMVAIYIGVAVLAAALCKIVRAFLKFASLAFADRLLGAMAGLLKAAVLIMFLYVGLTTYSPFFPTEWMGESYVMRGAHGAWPPLQAFLRDHNLFPENFTLPELDLPGPSTGEKAGENGG